MSKSVVFYRIKEVSEKLPEIVDLDEDFFDYVYTVEEGAKEWVKELGQKCRIRYRTVNVFEACEKIYREKPTSISYRLDDVKECQDENGREIGVLTNEMLEPYYYTKEYAAYVYQKEEISYVNAYYLPEVEDGVSSFEELLELARKCIEQEENFGGVNSQAIVAVMKAAFAAKDGARVYCYTD